MTIRRKITVEGRVQGVFYRASTRDKAFALGLAGYVLNLPNGKVLIEVEGPVDKVQELINWARQGPPMSRVKNVIVEEVEGEGLSGFEIRS